MRAAMMTEDVPRIRCCEVPGAKQDGTAWINLFHTEEIGLEENAIPNIQCNGVRFGLLAPPAFLVQCGARSAAGKAHSRNVRALFKIVVQSDVACEHALDLATLKREFRELVLVGRAAASCGENPEERKQYHA